MADAAVINGKVVAITGGARGIGLATATALHRLGARVAIGDVDEVAVKEAGTALGLDVYALPLDPSAPAVPVDSLLVSAGRNLEAPRAIAVSGQVALTVWQDSRDPNGLDVLGQLA